MDINERSKEYAEGKALAAINAAIEQAYRDGYNDGLKHLELERLEAIKEGVEYVDLGLKSGTLWSSKYVNDSYTSQNRLPYIEALKLNIPTKEQFEELCRECFVFYKIEKNFHGIQFLGKNGNSIVIQSVYISQIDSSQNSNFFRFWIKDIDGDGGSQAYAAWADGIANNNKIMSQCKPLFEGLHLPVMLVKKEQK